MIPEHHLQKEILYKLVHARQLRFSELKPSSTDGNIFTYHLQQLVKAGLIQKDTNGRYELTAAGKALGITSSLTTPELLLQAHSILLLAVKSGDSWLLRRRLVQPVYGKWGFIHGEPKTDETIIESASRIFTRRTGLNAEFTPRGAGYIRIFNDQRALESFTHFTLLTAEITKQIPINVDDTGENKWFKHPNFADATMIISMADLTTALRTEDFFFHDLTYTIDNLA